jgi:hypothetical protein
MSGKPDVRTVQDRLEELIVSARPFLEMNQRADLVAAIRAINRSYAEWLQQVESLPAPSAPPAPPAPSAPPAPPAPSAPPSSSPASSPASSSYLGVLLTKTSAPPSPLPAAAAAGGASASASASASAGGASAAAAVVPVVPRVAARRHGPVALPKKVETYAFQKEDHQRRPTSVITLGEDGRAYIDGRLRVDGDVVDTSGMPLDQMEYIGAFVQSYSKSGDVAKEVAVKRECGISIKLKKDDVYCVRFKYGYADLSLHDLRIRNSSSYYLDKKKFEYDIRYIQVSFVPCVGTDGRLYAGLPILHPSTYMATISKSKNFYLADIVVSGGVSRIPFAFDDLELVRAFETEGGHVFVDVIPSEREGGMIAKNVRRVDFDTTV